MYYMYYMLICFLKRNKVLLLKRKGLFMSVVRKIVDNETAGSKINTEELYKSHANDPYVVKKATEAKDFLAKAGIPEQIKNK